MKKSFFAACALVLLVLFAFSGCSTLSVKIPDDMYVSMGDYAPGVKTEGIIQAHVSAWTPFIVLYDMGKIRENLYKQLLDKANGLIGVDGITNVSFYSKPSPLCVLAPFTFGAGIWTDYYAEGVVITVK